MNALDRSADTNIHPKAFRHNILHLYTTTIRMDFMLLVIVVYYYAVFSSSSPDYFLLWESMFTLYILLSGVMMIKYEKQLIHMETKVIENILIGFYFFTSMFIGVGSLILYDVIPEENMSMALIVTASVLSGTAVVSLSFPAFLAVGIPMLFLTALAAAMHGGNWAQAGIHFAGIPITIYLSHKVNQFYLRTASMQFHNQDLLEAAEKTTDEKNKFLSRINHDLRQPMNAIQLYLEVIDCALISETQASAKAALKKAQQCNTTLSNLLDSVVEVGQRKVTQPAVHKTCMYLPDLFQGIQNEWQPQFDAQKRVLSVKPLDVWLESDQTLLLRILNNLIANALKHTQENVDVYATTQQQTLLLSVSDQGAGIPQEKQESVFLEHVQLGEAGKKSSTGFGLGLSIVKQLAHILNHGVSLQSDSGQGSCFSISVAIAKAPISTDKPIGAFIVVVDDDKDILQSMEALLVQWGCDVLVAENGKVLRDAWLTHDYPTPDALITDFNLGGQDSGVEVAHWLQEACNTSLPVLLITGERDLPDDVYQLPNLKETFHKPVNAKELKRVLIDSLKNQ